MSNKTINDIYFEVCELVAKENDLPPKPILLRTLSIDDTTTHSYIDFEWLKRVNKSTNCYNTSQKLFAKRVGELKQW